GLVGGRRSLRWVGFILEVLGDPGAGWSCHLSDVEPGAPTMPCLAEAVARAADRTDGVCTLCRMECFTWLGIVRFPGETCGGCALPTVSAADHTCGRVAVRFAMDLATYDDCLRRRSATWAERMANLVAVLSGRATNRRVCRGFGLEQSARAVSLGSPRIPD